MPSIVLLQRDHEASPRLQSLIDASEHFKVSGTAHTVEQAHRLIREAPPDILVTDMRVQDGEVQPLLTELRRGVRRPGPHVIVTMLSHDDTALLEALRSGADGYWVHTQKPGALIGALEQVSRGESPISPTIARHLLSHFRTPAQPRFDSMTESLDPLVLTGTEQEILQWAAQGYLIDEIAQQWQSSVHSVACGVRAVYHKLQFDRRASGLSLKAA
ncbi:hypothetical protein ACVNIS_00835 [Sphaerotilaceae bacterium SBD11-9]